MVYVKRFSSNSDGRGGRRIAFPIKLNENNLIPFTRHQVRYNHINGNRFPTEIAPLETRHYRIGAAIIQRGELDTGHYVCMERAPNGSIIEHSDASIRHDQLADFGKFGYFLRLDLVE